MAPGQATPILEACKTGLDAVAALVEDLVIGMPFGGQAALGASEAAVMVGAPFVQPQAGGTVVCQSPLYAVENAPLAPPGPAIAERFAGSIHERRMAPAQTVAQEVDDGAQDRAVVGVRDAALPGEECLQPADLFLGQQEVTTHRSARCQFVLSGTDSDRIDAVKHQALVYRDRP